MNVDDVFTSKYLKAADLQGKEVSVTIVKAGIETMKDGTNKIGLFFQGKEKGLLLNKTNTSRISAMYGKETDDWIGKKVTLGAEWVDFKGETVEAVRVQMRGRSAGMGNSSVQHSPPPPASAEDYGAVLDDSVPF